MGRLRHLYLLFFLSGFSGLVYESMWSRFLRLFVGSASTAQVLMNDSTFTNSALARLNVRALINACGVYTDLGGSTIAGTFGYMAPEQFAGDARPATDLYALAATMIALLTARSPSALQDARGQLRWREAVRDPGLRQTTLRALEAMLEPDMVNAPE